MERRYHTLIVRDPEIDGGRWHIEFGDYDKEVVRQERLDRHDSYPNPKLNDMRVITTRDALGAINEAVRAINAKEGK